MLNTDDICTLPRKHWGLAWLLLQKNPDISLNSLAGLVSTTQRLDDLETVKATSDDVVCMEVIAKIPRDVTECRHPREVELCRVALGDDVCDGLASGLSLRVISEITGIARETVRRRVALAKHTITPKF